MMHRLLALWVGVAVAWDAADEIRNLPGLQGPLASRQFSGYVQVDGDAAFPGPLHVHYWLVEHEAATKATGELDGASRLLLWSNGGPGASSAFGLLGEVGPYLLSDASLGGADVPVPQRNPQSWARLGHLVIFDWPPPVGFSYCGEDPAGPADACGDWDDERMQRVSKAVLQALLEDKFPELQASPLYLTGESYAGVYVPKLAQAILEDAEPKASFPWQLQGFAVGDACAGTEVVCGGDTGQGNWWDLLFLYGHGQMSTKLFEMLVVTCGMGHLQFLEPPVDPEACSAAQAQVQDEVGGFYEYHVYDDCIYEDDLRRRLQPDASLSALRGSQTPSLASAVGVTIGGAVNDYACGTGPVQARWLGLPEVREALHVPVSSYFFSADGVGFNYRMSERSLMPFYREVVGSGLRVLVYNGDADPGINSFVAQNWTSALGVPEVEAWRPWTLDGCRRMGGYVTRYEGAFDFLTIRGAGHMVPEYKPEAAFEFLRRWLDGDAYPRYDKSCVAPSPEATVRRVV